MSLFEDILNQFHDREKYDEHRLALHDHIIKFYSDSEVNVLTEIIVLDIRIDTFIIEPKHKKFNIVITSGMSSMEMISDSNTPNWKNLKFAELMMLLPTSINIESLQNGGEFEWIINMLKQTAKFPHYEKTWLGMSHAIQGNVNSKPYDNNYEFIGGLILPSITLDKTFTEIQTNENIINLYSFFPLYKNELQYKFTNGFNAILDIIIEKNISEIFNPIRENLFSSKKKRFKF